MPSKVFVKPYSREGRLVKGYWRKIRVGDLIHWAGKQGRVVQVSPGGIHVAGADGKKAFVQAKQITNVSVPGQAPVSVDRTKTATDYTKGGSVAEALGYKPGTRTAGKPTGSYAPEMAGTGTRNEKTTANVKDVDDYPEYIHELVESWPDTYQDADRWVKNAEAYSRMGSAIQDQLDSMLDGGMMSDQNPNAMKEIANTLRGLDLDEPWASQLADAIEKHLDGSISSSDNDYPETFEELVDDWYPEVSSGVSAWVEQSKVYHDLGGSMQDQLKAVIEEKGLSDLNANALGYIARALKETNEEWAFDVADGLESYLDGTANIKDKVKEAAIAAARAAEGASDAVTGALPTTGKGAAHDIASLATYIAQNFGPALGTGNVKFLPGEMTESQLVMTIKQIEDSPRAHRPASILAQVDDYLAELREELLKRQSSPKMAAFDESLATMALSEDEMDHYLSVSLMAKSGGFSKGTANVTAKDVKKLSPLMRHYAKKAHPFTSCVRDNRKRFGPRAEAVCAVLKDLIKGTTKWRGKGKKADLSEEFFLDVPPEFEMWLSMVTPEQIQDLIDEDEMKEYIVEEPRVMAELFFSESMPATEDDGLVWKTVLREGEWMLSPGPGQRPQNKPIRVVPSGRSDGKSLVISMQELKENFDAGAVEHVTVPVSHADKVTENTGYVRDLKFGKDHTGRQVLMAGLEFTEPEIADKVKRGTIANISSGILFDYAEKETGKKYAAVLGHAALTNKPWLNGMPPFGVQASEQEGLRVLAFSEGTNNPATTGGGEVNMPDSLMDKLGLSEDEISARLADYDRLREQEKERSIDDRVKAWEAEGKAPALVTAARGLMMADDGASVLNLSEEGSEVGLSATDIVERLVNAAPNLGLSQDPVTDRDTLDEKPADDATDENAAANLSQEVKNEAASIFLSGEVANEAEALVKAKEKLGVEDKTKS